MLSFHAAEGLAKKVKFGIELALAAPILYLGLVSYAVFTDPEAARGTLTAIAVLSPLWLPLFLLRYFWIYWIHYIRFKFWFSQEMILLAIQLPAEVTKSPLAMEPSDRVGVARACVV